MPIYEYRCLKCNHSFEIMQKIADSPLTTCISCQGPVRKLISPTSFHLKGNGWYATDYVKKSGANGDNKEKTKETSTPKETSTSPEGTSKGDQAAG